MPQELDDKQEALRALTGGDPGAFVAAWLDAIEASGDEEKTWRTTQAEDATRAYKGDETSASTAFNIYHSNIETLVPALYNSAPIPDVRRRFLDDDKVAADASNLIERAISFSIDDYDFDDTMKKVVKDMAVVDRGVARIRYEHTENAEGEVVYEEARCEYVPWRCFRRGPATQWDRLPWVAFEHYLSKDEVEKLLAKNTFGDAVNATIRQELKFGYSAESKGDDRDVGRTTPKFGKRERVWEIWDKDTRTVVWVSHDYKDSPLAVMEDPLGLKNFFPTPRPAMVIESTDSLTPITSYSIYCKLIEELNTVTERISALVEQIRVRGGYAGVQAEIEQIANAADGELVALNNAEIFATAGGGLEKAVLWWPIEPVILAVKELIVQREQIKQTIYEVTGLADIIRGATDPNETATAQNIKQQWGSIRIQSHQKEVERYARDLFRLKAEVMCKHFAPQTMLLMTGMQFPTAEDIAQAQALKAEGEQKLQEFTQQGGDPSQLPPELQQAAAQVEETLSKTSQEDLFRLLRDDRVLRYRVDVESDSTVRADLTKNQEQMKGFLEGTAAYAGAVGPMVQEGVMDPKVAIEIFSAFARNFRLGKQAEDSLDEWADKIKREGVQGKPPDPNVQAEADLKVAQAEKLRVETDLLPQQFQADQDERQAVFERDSDEKQKRLALDERAQAANENMAKHDTKLRAIDLRMRGKQHDDQMTETRRAREDAQALEHKKLKDGRQARMEGYQAGQMPNEQGQVPPMPEQMPLEDEYMTTEERELLAQNAQALMQSTATLQAVAQALAQSIQTQQQGQAAMVQALQAMTQALTAPKMLVRDGSGRAVGTQIASPNSAMPDAGPAMADPAMGGQPNGGMGLPPGVA